MAGVYPDVPGHRIAYDRDGSIAFQVVSGTPSELTSTQTTHSNDEGDDIVYSVGNAGGTRPDFGILFSVPHDLDGYTLFVGSNGSTINHPQDLKVSTDTTNGVDGTWTTVTAGDLPRVSDFTSPGYRSEINSLAETGIQGIKFTAANSTLTGDMYHLGFHVYGSPSAGEAPDRLRIWHPTNDEEVGGAYFDFGDVNRSTTLEREFRVKNPSSMTANDVSLTMEALTDTTPTNVGQYEFSADGTTWTSSLDVGDLAPGAVSSVLTLRRVTLSTAALTVWATRIVASASSYT